jgi:hypothetical protein
MTESHRYREQFGSKFGMTLATLRLPTSLPQHTPIPADDQNAILCRPLPHLGVK